MAKVKDRRRTIFMCPSCGNESAKWLGFCPAQGCGSQSPLVETAVAPAAKGRPAWLADRATDVVELSAITPGAHPREPVRGELSEKEIDLEITQAVKVHLGEKGFDPVLGARPLRRLIQDEIEDNLSDEVLSKRLVAGDVAMVDFEDDAIKITAKKAKAKPKSKAKAEPEVEAEPVATAD